MDYRYLGRSGFRVPALSLGTATFGGKGDFFAAWGDTGAEQATRLVDMCLDFASVGPCEYMASDKATKPSTS
jgi:aryl-alcohol dehydrogenase-like predicted oxidoreductase